MSSKAEPKKGGFLADYRSVNERIHEFYSTYPKGRIVTSPVKELSDPEKGIFAFRAELFRDERIEVAFATGTAIETPTSGQVNRQGFALENAETSSIGRALQNAGIATKASEIRPEEMARIERAQGAIESASQPNGSIAKTMADLVTPRQMNAIVSIANAKRMNAQNECVRLRGCRPEELSRSAASEFIDQLRDLPQSGEGVAPREPAQEQSKVAPDKQNGSARDETQKKAKSLATELNSVGHPDFRDKISIKFWLRAVAKKKWSIQVDPESLNTAEDLPDDLYDELPGLLQAELDEFKREQADKQSVENDLVF